MRDEVRLRLAASLCWAGLVLGAPGSARDAGAAPVPSPVPVPGIADSTVRRDSATVRHRFDDPAQWSRVWDDPERDGWQEPRRVVDLMRLRPGMRVADIGAGTGYFEHWLARAVGPQGVVYAADIETTMVVFLRARAQREATPNVIAVLATPDDPGLPTGTLDRVLLVDTYHHIDGRVAYFQRLRARLAERGLVAIVDWQSGELARGPAPEHKIAPEVVMDEMRRAGFAVVERTDLKYQYVLLFRLAPPTPAGPKGAAVSP